MEQFVKKEMADTTGSTHKTDDTKLAKVIASSGMHTVKKTLPERRF